MSRLGREDAYFMAQEAEQRAKLRAELEAKAALAAEHHAIAEQVGVTDRQLAERVRALGFDGETARVLYLMPLIAVAWADGSLSDKERDAILRVAGTHGIEPHTPAGIMLATLLEERSSGIVLDQILDVLKAVLHAKGMHPHSMLEACVEVAEASGGFLGFGNKVSPEEQALIEQIAGTFGPEDVDRITERLD
ncbi:MAG: TerB family tellurite resistance protein [Phycisphaerae bacterium]|nr:TerB family tellurite resistance protein [Phycisphaerae bacterium]